MRHNIGHSNLQHTVERLEVLDLLHADLKVNKICFLRQEGMAPLPF